MPLPFTRPIRHRHTTHAPGQLSRGSSPAFRLPNSNPIELPYGSGSLHTIKEPGRVLQVPALRTLPTFPGGSGIALGPASNVSVPGISVAGPGRVGLSLRPNPGISLPGPIGARVT